MMLIPGNGPRNHKFSILGPKEAIFPGISNIFKENQFLNLDISRSNYQKQEENQWEYAV